jgi:hypothetical protein
METFGAWVIIAVVVWALVSVLKKMPEQSETKAQRENRIALQRNLELVKQWGSTSLNYICPHCQTKGKVRTMPVKRKKGVSGAKLTGAAFTLGLSIIATGLSRKEGLTQAHCENCGSTWDF